MSNSNEDAIEQNLIELLQAQGYEYCHGTALDRDGFDGVVLEQQFKAALKRLNPDVPESARSEVFQKVMYLGSDDVMRNNERLYLILVDVVTVEYFI